MSDANSQLLNFVCPKCQKKLRAPANLAGQKLACPKCSSPIRVPGVVETSKDDDEWLSLNEPSQPTKPAKSPPKVVQPSAKAPVKDTAPKETAPKAPDPLAPAPKAPAPVADETDDLLLAPPESIDSTYRPQKPVSSEASSKPSTAQSVFDDDLPDLAPLDDSPNPSRDVSSLLDDAILGDAMAQAQSEASSQMSNKPKGKRDLALPDVPLPELSLETPALVGGIGSSDDEEFTFACKVCGSRLTSSRARVGSNTSCPDCYTKLKVPPLPKKAKPVDVKMDAEVARVTFAPVDSLSIRDPRNSAVKTKEILDKAEQALEDERDEFIDGTFDTKRWIGFLFGFLQDPMVIAAAVVGGVATGLWFFLIAALGTWIPLEGAQVLIAQIVVLCVFSIPVSLFICMCGIAILAMTANQLKRVQQWPFAKISESMGECGMVLVALLMASIPGGMLGVLFNSLNAHPVVSLAFVLIGIWGLTPLLLLSMIDNSSILEPYSKAVWLSIRSRPEAWGAMYMQTGLAFVMFLIFIAMASMKPPIGDFFVGFFLPLMCFFQFSQYGVLAGRISDVTEMGFEGDFSED